MQPRVHIRQTMTEHAGRPAGIKAGLMKPRRSQNELIRLSIQSGMMLAEANMVIAMRLFGMAGMWKIHPGETNRMVQEKTDAAMASGAAMAKAMGAGKSPAAMRTHSAVGIHDYLPASETSIAMRTANYKSAGRIDQDFSFRTYHVGRNNFFDYMLNNIRL